MKFTTDHLNSIKEFISSGPISLPEMRDNIIDHLACAVEYKMMNGIAFDNALQTSVTEFAPNGLEEIENETYLLLHSKTIIMKKLTYLSGLIFSMIASAGVFCKILRWEGANELIIAGFGGLVLVFLPLLSFTRKPVGKSTLERSREVVFLAGLALFSVGAVLKIMHMVSANEFLLLGTAAFSLGYLPLTFFKMYKEAVAA